MNNSETNEIKQSSTEVVKDEKTVIVEHVSPVNEDLTLKRLDEKFIYELMEVPTASKHEYRMVTFILFWAKKNNVKYELDSYGNIYLTKGEVNENEFYPCVTAHLDTVQTKQIFHAKAGAKLDVKTKLHTDGKKHKIYVDGFGIGGDDKAGLLIGLSMFKYFDKLKACFFLEEETGCVGSSHIDMKVPFYQNWFGNVGYVIGYDSPDLNRAAYACSGTRLMNKQFFADNGLDKICAEHGLNDFRSEPYTDVKQIREKTNIICMNFGSGYYNCHMDSEYCLLEDMDAALDMGVAIIEKLGNTSHMMKHVASSYNYNDETSKYFEGLKPHTTTQYGGTYYGRGDYYDDYDDDYHTRYNDYGGSSTTHSSTTTSGGTQNSTTTKIENTVTYDSVEYISKQYEDYINEIKENVKGACDELGINFDEKMSKFFEKKIEF